jgi:hypothetical protein
MSLAKSTEHTATPNPVNRNRPRARRTG